MLLTGTYTRNVDEKLRLAVPKPLRDALGCGPGSCLYIAPGTDGSLGLYTSEVFEQLARRLEGLSPTAREVRTYTRLLYARAARVELDKQGRVRVPAELAALVDLGREVVLLGVQDHVEVWASQRWETYLEKNQPQYDEIAEAALGGSQGNGTN